ncbi:hypothetical protein D3C72_1938960 [compost metagenome]
MAFRVAVDLAGIGLQRHAKFFSLGGGAFLHLDEKGIGVGFGNQANRSIGGGRDGRERNAERKRAQKSGNSRLHCNPPIECLSTVTVTRRSRLLREQRPLTQMEPPKETAVNK